MKWKEFQSELPKLTPGDQILLRSVSGEFFVGEVTNERILKRPGTGYRYSLRDNTLSHWCEIVSPESFIISQTLN
ncbi:hypothetical protein [Leptospira stimsonii]|uniref:Uncharacterized protein n=1 Tax=Leptospira stimsonii TaxID=2202203 RepID=A0A396YVA1_9LEPT|nr:hypothetical protein [Leptospira stimsonii]RHX87141.1 hypothetical protein DLM75_16630 [Leptospira stimsonii]